MRYLQESLEVGERPMCRSHLHGVYMVSAFFWFAGIAAFGWISDYFLWVYFGQYIPVYEVKMGTFRMELAPGTLGWLCTAGGAYIFIAEFIKFISTDLVITSKRLLYKTGFMKVNLTVTDIVDILGAHVDQGWFGQFFGYGKIHLDCRFIKDVDVPYVKNPYGVLKNLQRAKAALGEPARPRAEEHKEERVINQTLIQVTGPGPVYFVDKVPDDPKTSITQIPKMLGDNMRSAFGRKA